MTLIKSVLLGSAASLLLVAGAQAADLPTKKGAPAAEYVKVCKIGTIAGFIIPGSDTCLKISGYVQAHFSAGTLSANTAAAERLQDFDRLLRPRQLRVRRGQQHRLWPAALAYRYQRRLRQRL